MSISLSPHAIVEALDKYIIGQDKAKRAVAIALRNRYRRSMLSLEMQDEVTPKNIIMIGPTGVGKTEIARRMAKLVQAPFIKVEATKFTEVGYVGRDVESMVRDLAEASVWLVKNRKMESVKHEATRQAERRLANVLADIQPKTQHNPLMALFPGNNTPQETKTEEPDDQRQKRNAVLEDLRAGKLEHVLVEIEVEDAPTGQMMPGSGMELNIQDMFGGLLPKKTKKRRVSVAEARKVLEAEEAQKLIDMDEVTGEALELAERHGIIFIDEIDKIAGRSTGSGPDVSREGVQRDILPLVEGSTVMTKYGPLKTDYILFVAAGAFHISKISDLIPELQGRFPIKVELQSLTREDLKRILTQPENALIKQYASLLEVDNVHIEWKEDAIDAMAEYAHIVNETTENIGARRLHTIMESLLEDISYNASGEHPIVNLVIDAAYVREHLKEMVSDTDLANYIL